MKCYLEPELEIIKLNTGDILTDSENGTETGGYEEEGGWAPSSQSSQAIFH